MGDFSWQDAFPVCRILPLRSGLEVAIFQYRENYDYAVDSGCSMLGKSGRPVLEKGALPAKKRWYEICPFALAFGGRDVQKVAGNG